MTVIRPTFLDWAESRGGAYLPDRAQIAAWPAYQREILAHLFPAGPDRLPYGRIVWSCPKKSAKSTLAAALHLWFALFVDVPGEQYVLANDLEGGRNRVFRYLVRMVEQNPILRRNLDWWATADTVRLANRSTIRAIPADVRGEAGGNQSFATVDEPWGILHLNHVRLATEFSPVPTRPNSTIFYTGYQGWAGSAWWHALIDTGLAGEPVPELAHLENGDGQPACWRNGRLFVYYDHVPRMAWHTPDYLAEQRRVLPEEEYRRVWENRRAGERGLFCPVAVWDSLFDPGVAALTPNDPRSLVLGVDAATQDDSTALVGCTLNQGRVEVIYSRVWPAPVKLTATLGAELARLAREANVAAVYYDPYQMAAVAEGAEAAGLPMVAFPQTGRRVQADTHLHALITEGRLHHTGDSALRAHVTAAAAQSTPRGLRLIKGAAGAKIDGAVALSMAALGAVEVLSQRGEGFRVAQNPFF